MLFTFNHGIITDKNFFLILFLIYLGSAKYTDKNVDENRPYEFGFKIEGEQHRQEKKDERGIITGEFGFITADGIYHVTVYATDEEGRFIIKSIKSYRVRPPLDGIGKRSTQTPTHSVDPTAASTAALGPSSGSNPTFGPSYGSSITNAPAGFTSSSFNNEKNEKITHLYDAPKPTHLYDLPSPHYIDPTTGKLKAPYSTAGIIPDLEPPHPDVNTFNRLGDISPYLPPSQNPYGSIPSIKTPPTVPGLIPDLKPLQPNIQGDRFDIQLPPSTPSTTTELPQGFTTHNILELRTCGGCAIPSTTKLPPGADPKRLNFQTPGFQDKPAGGPVKTSVSQQNEVPIVPQNLVTQFQINPLKLQPPKIPPIVASSGQNSRNNGQYQPDNGRRPTFGLSTPSRKTSFSNDDNGNFGLVEPRFNDRQPRPEEYPDFPNQDLTVPSPSEYPTIPTGVSTFTSPLVEAYLKDDPTLASFLPNTEIVSRSLPTRETKIAHTKGPIKNERVFFPGLVHPPQEILTQEEQPQIEGALPPGITVGDMAELMYKFNYSVGFHGHHERGYRNGAKIGGYYINGRDGYKRIVEYVADERGYRPKVYYVYLGLDHPDTPKEDTEKSFGLRGQVFEWFSLS